MGESEVVKEWVSHTGYRLICDDAPGEEYVVKTLAFSEADVFVGG